MEWTNEAVFQFLEAYQMEPCIWNPGHPLHKNRNEVTDAWKRILEGLQFNCTLTELKKKKDSLMASFRMLLNKKKCYIKSGNGTDEVFKPNWFAYETMENFLAPVYHCNTTINTETTMEGELCDQEPENGDFEAGAIKEMNYKEIPRQHTASASASGISTVRLKNTTENTATRMHKRCRDTFGAEKCPNEAFNLLKDISKKKQQLADDDECDMYAALLARKLRKFDDVQREILMNQIDNLVFERRMAFTSQTYIATATLSPTSNSIPFSPSHSPSSPSSI